MKTLIIQKLPSFLPVHWHESIQNFYQGFSSDGHEIGSHYNHHDLMTFQSLEEIEDNLGLAKESIKLAVGDDPLGFRAPAFSIKPDNYDVFNLIGKYFKYDSSCVVHSNE